MGMFRNLLVRFGLAELKVERTPINVFLLDDVEDAKSMLADTTYDAIFLDHDLLPHHYESNDHDDFARTGYAIAEWLNTRPDLQKAATIIVHTRNADAAIPMVQKLRESGRNVEYCAFPTVSYTHLRAHETPEHLVC